MTALICTKVGYGSRAAATHAAGAISARSAIRLRAYACPDCSAFHLTSQSPSKARARRRRAAKQRQRHAAERES